MSRIPTTLRASDSAEGLQIVHQYLDAGAKQVWVLYLGTKDVPVFEANRLLLLSGNELLEGRDVSPGFAMISFSARANDNSASICRSVIQKLVTQSPS
jgi:hypothetical protein